MLPENIYRTGVTHNDHHHMTIKIFLKYKPQASSMSAPFKPNYIENVFGQSEQGRNRVQIE
jgi:hypothetical protein